MRNLLVFSILAFTSFLSDDTNHWKVVFFDNFDDNKYNWVNETTDELTRISDGFLFYANPFDFSYYDAKPLAFNQNMDYSVEMKFRFISGDVQKYNGIFIGDLVFGIKNILEISPLGDVRVEKLDNSKVSVLFKGKASDISSTGFNILEIAKHGNEYIYIINGVEVYRHDYFPLNGKYLGFTISGGAYIQLAYIGMWYDKNN